MNNTFTIATYVCMDQLGTWISNVIWFGSFLCSMILMWDVIVDICRIIYHHCLYFLFRVMHHYLIRVTQRIYNAYDNICDFGDKNSNIYIYTYTFFILNIHGICLRIAYDLEMMHGTIQDIYLKPFSFLTCM